jgi:peptidoglycan hydrolase-like protein with peptidoglycan-binding domain
MLLVGNVVVLTIGLAIVSRVRSPADVAAEAAPPRPSTITVEVEERELVDSIVARGTVEPASSTALEAPEPGGDDAAIVTAVGVAQGEELSEGDLLVEVSGRPLFVLTGPIPAYRDLEPSARGREVEQLQEALRRLGLYRRSPTGVFDATTQAAVDDLYERADLDPVTVPGDDARAGLTLPSAEILFVPDLPAMVEDLGASIGTDLGGLEGPLASLSLGGLVVRTSFNEADVALITEGDAVMVGEEGSDGKRSASTRRTSRD